MDTVANVVYGCGAGRNLSTYGGKNKETENIPYLLIDPFDDEGRLKTDESKRAIPIHNQLIKMGFLAFVEKQVKASGEQFFPLLKPNKRG